VTEEVWRGLTGGESVHLTDWPEIDALPATTDLVGRMDQVRDIARAGLSLRKAHGKRVRLPLSRLTVVSTDVDALRPFGDIIAEELNVKDVSFVEHSSDVENDFGVARRIQVNARALGPRIGKDVQRVIADVKAGRWEFVDGGVAVGEFVLTEGEYESVLDLADQGTAVEFLIDGGFVLLDTTVTAELEREGLARDLIRAIQQERKNAGFDVSDRISLQVRGNSAVVDAMSHHGELIAAETLAVSVDAVEDDGDHPVSLSDGHLVAVVVSVS
jgi:isoleucyl-tRNA synthetase